MASKDEPSPMRCVEKTGQLRIIAREREREREREKKREREREQAISVDKQLRMPQRMPSWRARKQGETRRQFTVAV